MTLAKPPNIASSSYRSAKWDEIVEGRDFRPSDIPALSLLVQWYQVVEQCIEDMSIGDGIQVAFSNDMGDIKAFPQISTMKQASAEIRALNKQLGINDGYDSDIQESSAHEQASVLTLIQGRRADRRAAASD